MSTDRKASLEADVPKSKRVDEAGVRFVLDHRVDGAVGMWRRSGPGEKSGAPIDAAVGVDLPTLGPTLSRCHTEDLIDLVAARMTIARRMLLAAHGELEQHRFERYPLVVYELRRRAQVFWRLEVVPNGSEARMREAFI